MLKKRIKRVTILIMCLVILAVSVMPFTGASAAGGGGNSYFHVSGNKILDSNNHEVKLTGIAWFGYETPNQSFHGLWNRKLEDMLDQIADLGFNLMRVPLCVQTVNQWRKGSYPDPTGVEYYCNPDLKGKTSLDILDITMSYCKKIGLKVMFDMHRVYNGYQTATWYVPGYTTQDYEECWKWLVNRYKDNDALIAADLFNEPHGSNFQSMVSAKWDNSADENNWKYESEKIGSSLLDITPNLLIVVEGVEAYPKPGSDYTTIDEWGKESHFYFNWWGGNLRGVAEYPVNLPGHVIYSPHDYGASVYKQPWFYTGFNQDTLTKEEWDPNWLYIHKQNLAPILVGEWGGKLDGGDNETWMRALAKTIEENGLNHTFWCINPNSGDTGGILKDDWITVDTEKYNVVLPTLWRNSEGKFIGLDPEVPLGKNGISLGEYYKNGEPVQSSSPIPTVTSTPKPTPTTSVIPTITPVIQSPTPTSSDVPDGVEFKVDTIFEPQKLVANQMMTAKVTAANISTVPYTGTKDVLLIVGLYDKNNTMVNVSYISKGISYQGKETLSAGFKLPSNISGYSVRAFMWDGEDISTTNMIPLSNMVQIP